MKYLISIKMDLTASSEEEHEYKILDFTNKKKKKKMESNKKSSILKNT